MKQALTTNQVNDNLIKLFPGKAIECTEVIIDKWNPSYYYFTTKAGQFVLIGKMLWQKPTIKEWAKYIIYCKDSGIMYQKIRTKIGTLIPFIYIKNKNFYSVKDAKIQQDLILQACGLKSEKTKEDSLSRLQILKAKDYVTIYKMIKELDIVKATIENKEIFDRWNDPIGYKTVLTVCHTKGSFTVPMEGITGNDQQDDEIRNIFANLLGLKVTTYSSELIAA